MSRTLLADLGIVDGQRMVEVKCGCGRIQTIELRSHHETESCRPCSLKRMRSKRPNITPGFTHRDIALHADVDRQNRMREAWDADLHARMAGR